ncbi:uncharacterized protein C8A04DRAFT_38669 [Dichotomopilus funicola]|uniref:Uncharacterized protein n=1 Tax=Dichotomopilus funicola TaxID=1934379 RepID=A0AAN6UZI7_9PEZI|nr:hypothetical protein C8A04DRAFT_38669 [Dichotomopilus funicola]
MNSVIPISPSQPSSRIRQAPITSTGDTKTPPSIPDEPLEIYEWSPSAWDIPQINLRAKAYKPPADPVLPIPDPFPLLSQNPPPSRDLLQPPRANRPPKVHVPEQTPLFIGFTRNWPQLLQCVVSYVAAGWPAEDIWVVENTGAMDANARGRLTLQNPFYLNHTQLGMLGVRVIMTPTLLTFAQLQNFYLWTALTRNYPHYFWSHQDVIVFSNENATAASPLTPFFTNPKFKSQPKHPSKHPILPPPTNLSPPTLYTNAVLTLRYLTTPSPGYKSPPAWAHHFFAYDHLALVNRDAVLSQGGWDTHIPFYSSDCDTYLRLRWAGLEQTESYSAAGRILDVGSVLGDVGALLRIPGVRGWVEGFDGEDDEEEDGEGSWKRGKGKGGKTRTRTGKANSNRKKTKDASTHESLYTESYDRLLALATHMQHTKYARGNHHRNTWQVKQRGGQGEPFYRDADGFETGVQMQIDLGRKVFAEKWGHRGCDVEKMGVRTGDAWRLERDWDEETEGGGHTGGSW